jgi:hypothetical protein
VRFWHQDELWIGRRLAGREARMIPTVERLVFASVLLFLAGALSTLHAQGGATSSISGVVNDSAGGVIPGASVVVTSNATGTKFEAVTNSTGAFNVPALSPGVYTVTVSLEGFKTAEVTDVRVQPAFRRPSMRYSKSARSWKP